jgi:hypothetical protein
VMGESVAGARVAAVMVGGCLVGRGLGNSTSGLGGIQGSTHFKYQ